jgi:TatD DNase family protein
LIDSHAHLTFPDYGEETPDRLVARAVEAGVERIINVAFDIPSNEEVVALAERDDRVSAVVGIHPHEADRAGEEELARVEMLAPHPEVVGIGETGLDYYRDYADHRNQERLFHRHLEIAARIGKPVVIHDREAHDDVLGVLREHHGSFPGGVMHCFSGGVDLVESVLPLGFYISIPGTVTFSKGGGKLADVIRACPIDRLMIETDCPWLAPAPHRGKTNEPAYVVFVRDRVAEILGLDAEEVGRKTSDNTKRLFHLGA